MKVLVACEFSGVVRDAFLARGHDAWSCDLLPTEVDGPHIQGDIRNISGLWDLMIAHPPCTYLSRAGARWWLSDVAIPRIAIENPIGQLNYLWRYPDQVINPCDFGDPFTKRTCLWLRGLPPLMATKVVPNAQPWLPSNSSGFRRGQRSLPGVVHGGAEASRSFPGIANAMADQWGAIDMEVAA